MILKELYELYNRLVNQGECLPTDGEWMQDVGLVIVLRPDGQLVSSHSVRYIGEPLENGKQGLVPLIVLSRDKTNKVDPGFLCDKLENILGIPAEPNSKSPGKLTQAEKYREKFPIKYSEVLQEFEELKVTGVNAVARFICEWNSDNFESLGIAKKDLSMYTVFQIEGCENYVHEEEIVKNWWKERGLSWWYPKEDITISQCLVTGKDEKIAHTHIPRLSRVGSKPAALVSYNKSSFESYGKSQGINAPVSEKVAASYCNALDYLLRRDISSIQIADTTLVFWTDAESKEDDDISVFLAGSAIEPERIECASAQDEVLVNRIRDDLERIAQGKAIRSREKSPTRFFVLALSPNEGRIVVRGFYQSSYGEFIGRLCNHYALLDIIPAGKKKEIIAPYMILKACTRITEKERDIYDVVRDRKAIRILKKDLQKNVPAHYVGALMQSILSGGAYPDFIASAIMRRLKTESSVSQMKKHPGYYQIRCAYLKAWLTRKNPSYKITTMLDSNNKETGYVLGRLLATFQKIQDEAHPNGLNRTIMDSYYASASTVPASVFPRIIRMNQHHMIKLRSENPGLQITRKKQIQEIVDLISAFPAYLSLAQQGLFALGFYHQTQAFYTSSKQEN